MTHREPLVDATIFVANLFAGRTDKSRVPYVNHCLRVSRRLGPYAFLEERVAAILHDVIEDTHVTQDDLARMFNQRVAWLVACVSRLPEHNLTYMQFIDRIIESGDPGAMRIKLADLYDNTSPGRLIMLPPGERSIEKRYNSAIARLAPVVGGNTVIKGDISIPVLEA